MGPEATFREHPGADLVPGRGDRHGTPVHVPVDRAEGTGTGVSAAERAATVRRLADLAARPEDFLGPGRAGGRSGH
ncbi:3,4-dihydroxy-2-butanone-4-phosphate synthase [Sphaerisporangium fuscum]|uniref:3,4-dihydroxy-2-butanone-4-phosphate synthase n=1 Tax=Sphaerisporangium fuscum TaxID=2835868 RepID=UPI001BDBD667|nr:3,4-dihydroxy-2-butanone-4-phosphate synthase [Sphaerisporangium fuscum]